MTINKNLPNMPKRGHPDQYGIDLPQSNYLDPQNISRMANEIYQEVPVPAGTPEVSEAGNLLNPMAFSGMSVIPPAPGPMQLVNLPGQIHTYRDGTTFEAADPASHLYLGETDIPDISNLAFGVLGSLSNENSMNHLYFLGDDPRTATLLPDSTEWDILKGLDEAPVSSDTVSQAHTPTRHQPADAGHEVSKPGAF